MRRGIIGCIGVLAMSSVPLATSGAESSSARAQDSLWLPWIGCWEGAAEVGGNETEPFIVCFRPNADEGGVDVLTYTDGELIALEQMFADDQARPLSEGGCEGSRTAGWSVDRSRVFLVSELQCGESVTRTTRGVLSMLPGGDGWVEIQAVHAGDERPVIGIRTFLPADESTLASNRIPDPAEGRELAVSTARAQTGGALTPANLVETVERAGAGVASALLVERGEPLGLEAETLKALSRDGVPGEVLDVMVAMTYPERFEISGSGGEVDPEIRADADSRAYRDGRQRRSFGGYSPWGLGYNMYLDPFWSSGYGFGYGGFGYSRYGYGGYGYGGYGSSIYNSPRLIFIQSPTVANRRPTLSRNRGAVAGGDAGARPSGRSPSASRAPSSRSGSRAAPQPSSSRGGSRAAPRPSSSSGGSDGGRRARPR